MPVSIFGDLTRKFYIAEIGTRKIMVVSKFGCLWRGDTFCIMTFYCICENA